MAPSSSLRPNLALGKTMSASSVSPEFSFASNANDGNQSNLLGRAPNNAFPQWLQVDLGASREASPQVGPSSCR